MESVNERQWFVYLGNHHEGPFSVEEVQSRISKGVVGPESYVWRDGLSDWMMLREVSELGHLLVAGAVTELPEKSAEPAVVPLVAELSHDSRRETEAQTGLDQTPGAHGQNESSAPPTAKPAAAVAPKARLPWVTLSVLLLVVTTGILGTLAIQGRLNPVLQAPIVKNSIELAQSFVEDRSQLLVQRFPKLGRWISPIRRIEEVSAEDFTALQAAARGSEATEGVKIALAVNRTDSAASRIWLSTNLPEGFRLEAHIVGKPDTLLNRFDFYSRQEVVVRRHLAEIGPIRYSDGQVAPKGDYAVFIVDVPVQAEPNAAQVLAKLKQSPIPQLPGVSIPRSLQKGVKLIYVQSLFLGGKKDAAYQSRLTDFHMELAKRSAQELEELQQFVTTLKQQFDALQSAFAPFRSKLRAKINPTAKKKWTKEMEKWESLTTALQQQSLKWTSEYMRTVAFHGGSYLASQQAVSSVLKLFETQKAFISGQLDAPAFEFQAGPIETSAQGAVLALAARIQQLVLAPADSSRLPERDPLPSDSITASSSQVTDPVPPSGAQTAGVTR